MNPYLSIILTGALIFGVSTLALGASRKSENNTHHSSATQRSHGATHHRNTGSHHSTNSGSKTHSNIPSN